MSNDSTRKPDPLSPDSILDLFKPSPLADLFKPSPLDKLFESERLAAAQSKSTLESLQAEIKRRDRAATPAISPPEPIPPAEPIQPESSRPDALTEAMRVAIAALSPNGGALPRAPELFNYLLENTGKGKAIRDISNNGKELLWTTDNGNPKKTDIRAVGERLRRWKA